MSMQLPVLKRTAKVVHRSDDKLAIEYLGQQVTLEGIAATLFGKMLPYLDGRSTTSIILSASREKPRSYQQL